MAATPRCGGQAAGVRRCVYNTGPERSQHGAARAVRRVVRKRRRQATMAAVVAMSDPSIAVLIPALDEAGALPAVLAEIPRELQPRIVVVDNGSTDATAEVARENGAEVVDEPRRGYGTACQAGLAHLAADPPEIVVVLDADRSDFPQQMTDLVAPIVVDGVDLVCGSRMQRAEPGALPPHVRWGNALATALISALHGHRYRDLGPFRALRWDALERLELSDPTYGWNAEMQVKAVQRGLRVREVPVGYRRRVGRSKISGTIKGSLLAGSLILWTVFALWLFPESGTGRAPAAPDPGCGQGRAGR